MNVSLNIPPHEKLEISALERADLRQIANMIECGTRVLDVGSGDGILLSALKNDKNVDGRGIEINAKGVEVSLSKGLAVVHGDAEQELPEYPDKSFDYVILSRTLPATRNPVQMLKQMLRIGKKGILSMPNFGYWRVRSHLLCYGTMPVTKSLDKNWYDTDNIHLCTLKDFITLASKMDIKIEISYSITNNILLPFHTYSFLNNLLSEEIVFVISDK